MIPDIIAQVPTEAFYAIRNQELWRLILSIHAQALIPDLLVVADRLEKSGTLDRVGGNSYLMDMADEHVSDAGVESRIRLVRDAHVRRMAIASARKLQETAQDGEEASEVVQMALSVATELSEASQGKSEASRNPLAASLSILTNIRPRRIRTGFAFLDDTFVLRPTNTLVIGARPACGKTSLAMGIAINAAKAGYRAMVNSLEMTSEELTESLMAHETGIKLDRIINRELCESEMVRCREVALACSGIEFVSCRTVAELRARANAMKLRQGLHLLLVDYLQLMSHPGSENRNQEVGACSRGLKQLSMDLGTATVILSQLSRAKDRTEPIITDLRESGEIEQDANMIALLWEGDSPGERFLKGVKNRRGNLMQKRAIGFDGSIVRFSDFKEIYP